METSGKPYLELDDFIPWGRHIPFFIYILLQQYGVRDPMTSGNAIQMIASQKDRKRKRYIC
jgi:hypothetical protein